MLYTVYSSHNDIYGRKSLVTNKHSLLLSISGSIRVIQKASSAFRAEISSLCAKILHLTAKSIQKFD
ncbi:hypothetical protein Y032_0005g2375 [Ancylostoma ceylanicum]|uniref:Uncharacterized protein n=1 Tax=Ancylostoma ceylanicum TaxID=53326 RepID=A0A016VQZ5_9BILA|nr:hypothetical protein Y032_0005g2375 [Ancylostoma ceylanicum]